MDGDRLKQIEEIYHSALEVPAGEREDFIAKSCGEDEELRREVEALLSFYTASDDLLKTPPESLAAEMFAEAKQKKLIGREVGHYKIEKLLGKGGMGEVYLAEDTKLDRKVAIKFLNEEFSRDHNKLSRFVQEAKAASALNHPNILTVYEIGESGGNNYIATELIEGRTLREGLQEKSFTLRETLKAGMQVAAALGAAHDAGIVHRDIKPENIMLRDDGFVKILDFGLAKLTEKQTEKVDTESETKLQVKTSPGMVMGTVAYMSPEQARGKAVDARSDIWSLGVIVYELLHNRTPFAGETSNDSIAAILTKEPAPMDDHTPPELERIIRKSLEKNADQRYQSVKDFLLDIKNLKRELEFAEELERSQMPDSTRAALGRITRAGENATKRFQALPSGKHDYEVTSGESVVHTTVSTGEHFPGKFKSNRYVFLIGAVILLSLIGYGVYRFIEPGSTGNALSFEGAKITKLTKSGRVVYAAISPDGRYFAHVTTDAGKQQTLFVRQTESNNDITVVPTDAVEYWGLTFSKDSNDIFYVSRSANSPPVLFRIPALGGTPQKIIEKVDSPVSFSPDGKQFTFVRGEFPKADESALMIANTDGTGEKVIATRKLPRRFYPVYFTGPSWSPDGESIAASVGGFKGSMASGSALDSKIIAVKLSDGTESELTKDPWGFTSRVEWLADGKSLLMIARDQTNLYPNIWHLSLAGGDKRQITNDLNFYRTLSLTADATRIVTIQLNRVAGAWIAPASDLTQVRQIVSPIPGGVKGVKWTPDGRIVYHDDVANTTPSVMNADGTGQKQLSASIGDGYYPAVSPDGTRVVFTSNRTGNDNIWIAGMDGSEPRQLTNGIADRDPIFSADGRWVIYAAYDLENQGLWKVPVEGGSPVRLTEGFYQYPVVSPDGAFIAALHLENRNTSDAKSDKIAVLPVYGGVPLKTFNFKPNNSVDSRVIWSGDSKNLIYSEVNNSIANLWSQPVSGGKPKQISNFRDGSIYSFALSFDGKQMIISRGTNTRDAILISNE